MRADPGLYDYWAWPDRPRIVWPGGARLALWVVPNIEFYELEPPPNPFRKAWARPHPDVLGYATRDYGNRVGQERLARVLDRYGIRATVSLSAAVVIHHPEIIALGRERGWEFFSHGLYNTRYLYGMSEEEERATLTESMALIAEHTGQHCDGYLAPALSHTERTIDLFAELGGLYTCDLFHDDQPTPVKTRCGARFVSIPYSLELNDTIVYVVQRVEPRRYARMIRDAFDRLYQEGERSGTVLCIPLHPYQVSHPHRLAALEEALDYICGHEGVWKATGREIARHFLDHYYDQALAAIAEQTR
ncbi:MAG: polysaccharide deacetylase family protein [Xanthomonadales bacterium]|nr:polysaccharide deacetylase family protein [Xanthomonadales bacterium]